jgi:hypothetical protein
LFDRRVFLKKLEMQNSQGRLKNFGDKNRLSSTLVPEVYFYYFHCEGERKNKPLVESAN